MTAVSEGEVTPGLVVHLDTDLLRCDGRCLTNARNGEEDRAVQGQHYFLVVELNCDVVVAVPLFSKWAPGSEQLCEALKSGLPEKWVGVCSFYSPWQHWKVPINAIANCSATEESTPETRRRYAVECPERLNEISECKERNREEWREP